MHRKKEEENMKKKIIASILTAALATGSMAPVYGAEFLSEPSEVEAAFSAGEEVFPAFTEETETGLPAMEKTGDNLWTSVQPIDEDSWEVSVTITPDKTGRYSIGAKADTGNEGESDTQLFLYSPDGDRTAVYPHMFYTLNQGETYTLIFSVVDYYDNMKAEFKVAQQPYVTGLEWAEKPTTVMYSDVNILRLPFEAGDGQVYGEFGNGKVKLTYSDGTSETVTIFQETKTGQFFKNEFKWDGKGVPKPGKCDVEFYLADIQNEQRLEGAPSLMLTVDIHDPKELPTIKNTGKATADLVDGTAYVRLETGSHSVYNISFDTPEDTLSIFLREAVTQYGYHTFNGEPLTLKPNTVYYMGVGGITGGNYNKITYEVKIGKIKLSDCTIMLPSSVVYNGKTQRPEVKVHEELNELKAGKAYTISYSNNKNIGTATVTIKGKGDYTGTIKKTFKILPAKPAISSAKRLNSTSAKLTWKKVPAATGYVVYRATGNKWTRVGTVKTTSFTDKKAKKGTTYKYKVRAYRMVNKKNIYGAYSAVKTVK